jgi:hypothetical protein
MKKITSNMWDKVERLPFNSFKKIGWYDSENNRFQEVARWRNTHGKTGANFGMLNIWTPLYDVHFFESQGGCNVCGGYNKPIANLEGCLYQLKKAIENNEITHEGDFNYSDCGSIDSLMVELKDYLQKMFRVKLFILDIC